MSIKPLGDRVVIKRLEAEETTKSGIIEMCIRDRNFSFHS